MDTYVAKKGVRHPMPYHQPLWVGEAEVWTLRRAADCLPLWLLMGQPPCFKWTCHSDRIHEALGIQVFKVS